MKYDIIEASIQNNNWLFQLLLLRMHAVMELEQNQFNWSAFHKGKLEQKSLL